MGKRGKAYTDLGAGEFFRFHGFVTESAVPARRKVPGIARFGGIVLLFLLMMSLTALPAGFTAVTAIIAAEPAVRLWKGVPDELPEIAIGKRNSIYDKNGVLIAQTWTEDRIELASLNLISPYVSKALISTEDKTFYQNQGFDPKGILRAAVTGRGGGSGITQQLVKNLQFFNLLGRENKAKAVEPTITRKIRELKMAIRYEQEHTKDEILLAYLNTVAFGGPSTYGIETASQFFFGKPATRLSLAEASALVGTAQNPVHYDMRKPGNKPRWKARQAEVLGRMVAEGAITRKQADEASAEELSFRMKKSSSGDCSSSKYQFYCQYVMDYLASSPRVGDTQEEREAVIARGGLQIRTYMDPDAMRTIDEYMRKNWGTRNRIVAPTAVVEPGTGGVTAFGVNREYGSGIGKTQINLPLVPAAEGSVYKMFMLAAALNNGMTESDLTFSSECPLRPGPGYDSPPGGFRNSNSCALQGGRLNYKQATAYSSNTWFVTLEMKVGVGKLKEFSKSVGLAAPANISERSLSYALGAVGNSPVDVAAAYATFANKGMFCPATPVKSITHADGTELAIPEGYNPATNGCRAVMSPKSASVVLKAMRANLSGEIPGAFGLKSAISGQDTVAKSGTNETYNSAWAHLSARYSVYTNVYDMTKTSRGVTGAIFKGRRSSGNTAQVTGGELTARLLAGKKKVPLDYGNTRDEFEPVRIDESDYATVPDVTGLRPAEALGVINSAGFAGQVSKERKAAPAGFPAGIVVSQSVSPGTKLSRSARKEVVLYVSR